MWDNIDLIFPQGEATFEGKTYKNEDIKNSNLTKITNRIIKPVHSMVENILEYTYYPNGDLIVRNIYSVYPPNNVDNTPVLNVYGQKMLNNFLKEKK